MTNMITNKHVIWTMVKTSRGACDKPKKIPSCLLTFSTCHYSPSRWTDRPHKVNVWRKTSGTKTCFIYLNLTFLFWHNSDCNYNIFTIPSPVQLPNLVQLYSSKSLRERSPPSSTVQTPSQPEGWSRWCAQTRRDKTNAGTRLTRTATLTSEQGPEKYSLCSMAPPTSTLGFFPHFYTCIYL